MVDELIAWPQKPKDPQAARIFGSGRHSCHLTTDGPLEELHAFAEKIGLRRAWFQDHPLAPHYDLTPSRRAAAVKVGAVEVPAREQARRRRGLPANLSSAEIRALVKRGEASVDADRIRESFALTSEQMGRRLR